MVMRVCRPWFRATLVSLCLHPAMLPAQPVYRCASSYSDLPCPGAATVDVDDSRSTAQKAQTDAATVQAARLADEMEATRLSAERPVAATPTRPGKKAASRPAGVKKSKRTKSNKPRKPNTSNTPDNMQKKMHTLHTANKKRGEPVTFTATTRKDGNTAAVKSSD